MATHGYVLALSASRHAPKQKKSAPAYAIDHPDARASVTSRAQMVDLEPATFRFSTQQVVLTYVVMAYVVMASAVMASAVMAYAVMAYMVMAQADMAYVVMA